MLGPFATTSRLTPIHQVSPLYCRTPPAHRCPQRRQRQRRRRRQQRQRVTEGTAMAPWNGPNNGAFTHTLRWVGIVCAGNSTYFNGGVHTLSYRRSSSRPIPSQRVFYYKSPIFTGSRSELVDPVLVGLVVLGPALHLNVLDVLSLVESTAQPRLPRHVVRSVNAFAILSRLLRPFLHTTATHHDTIFNWAHSMEP